MRRPQPLPPDLAGALITAEALQDRGISRFRAYASDLEPVRRGIRCLRGQPPAPPQIAAVIARRRESAVLCGVTAAQLHGMRLPGPLERSPLLHLARTEGLPRIRCPGVVGTEAVYADGEVMLIEGVPVTTPARTFLDLARLVSDEDLAAIGDGLVCEHRVGLRAGVPPVCTTEELRRLLAAHPGARGVRRARRALERVRVGVDSRPETRMRLMLDEHGVGEWVTDHCFRGVDGRLVQPDLWDERSRTSVQYEGLHHSDPRQVRRDVDRERATRSVGAVEVRVVAEDLEVHVRYGGRWVPRAVALVAAAVHRER